MDVVEILKLTIEELETKYRLAELRCQPEIADKIWTQIRKVQAEIRQYNFRFCH